MRAADSFRIFCGVLSVLKSMHSRGVTVRRVRPSMLRITASGVSPELNHIPPWHRDVMDYATMQLSCFVTCVGVTCSRLQVLQSAA